MDSVSLLDLWRGAIATTGAVAAPFLLAALAVGLLTSLIQAATQMQENVLSFVPKLIAVGLVLALAGPWVMGRMTRYTNEAFEATVTTARDLDR